MSYRLELQCPPTFEKVIENGLKIKEALVKRGVIKHYSETSNNTNHYGNNDKPKFWQKNRNTRSNEPRTDNVKLVFNLTASTTKENQNENQNNSQGTI